VAAVLPSIPSHKHKKTPPLKRETGELFARKKVAAPKASLSLRKTRVYGRPADRQTGRPAEIIFSVRHYCQEGKGITKI
jgi:hypothetical protein